MHYSLQMRWQGRRLIFEPLNLLFLDRITITRANDSISNFLIHIVVARGYIQEAYFHAYLD